MSFDLLWKSEDMCLVQLPLPRRSSVSFSTHQTETSSTFQYVHLLFRSQNQHANDAELINWCASRSASTKPCEIEWLCCRGPAAKTETTAQRLCFKLKAPASWRCFFGFRLNQPQNRVPSLKIAPPTAPQLHLTFLCAPVREYTGAPIVNGCTRQPVCY